MPPDRTPTPTTATTSMFPKITDQGLDDLRRRIGVEITDTLEPWCHEATRDGIRHYAHGIGDDNPLWCDPAYAKGTSWGDVIAPPSFLFATSRIISGYVGGLPGVHAMWAGADWTWHLPVRRNDAITARAWLKAWIDSRLNLMKKRDLFFPILKNTVPPAQVAPFSKNILRPKQGFTYNTADLTTQCS